MGDASSVTSSSSSHSTVIRARPSRVYLPDSGLAPGVARILCRAALRPRTRNSRHGALLPLPPPQRNRAFAPPALLPTTSRAVGSLRRLFSRRFSQHILTALRTISFLYLGDGFSGPHSPLYYNGAVIIASAEPVLVRNPSLHLCSSLVSHRTRRSRDLADLASPRLTRRKR